MRTKARKPLSRRIAVTAAVVAGIAVPAVAVPLATANAAARECYRTTHQITLYIPANAAELPRSVKDKLKQTDFDPQRGWRLGAMSLRQELETQNGTTVSRVNGYPTSYVTSSAGAVGVKFSLLSNVPGTPGGVNDRSEAQFNAEVRTPFGAWNPNGNYTISILTNANGRFYVSPSTSRPADGIHVSTARTYDC